MEVREGHWLVRYLTVPSGIHELQELESEQGAVF